MRFLLFFSQHGILTPSVYCIEYLLRPSVWMILIPPVIFPHWRGSRTKQQSYIQTHAMWRRDRSFRDLALNVWRVSALLSPGSYVGAIEARWLRRCCCHRRKNKKNFTTQDTCAIFNAWVLMHECFVKITYECLRMCDNYNSNSEIIIWWKCWWGWC